MGLGVSVAVVVEFPLALLALLGEVLVVLLVLGPGHESVVVDLSGARFELKPPRLAVVHLQVACLVSEGAEGVLSEVRLGWSLVQGECLHATRQPESLHRRRGKGCAGQLDECAKRLFCLTVLGGEQHKVTRSIRAAGLARLGDVLGREVCYRPYQIIQARTSGDDE